MEALFVPAVAVALAEIGDKTQLLSLLLATRYRNHAPAIIAGILIATLVNHGASVLLGGWLADLIPPDMLRYLVAASFLAVGLWLLVPDKADDESAAMRRMGPFLATLVLFFVAEIGDKTQIATVVLAGQYDNAVAVTLGTTLGMMAANVPVVLLGQKAMAFLPAKQMHMLACALFVVMAGITLMLG